MATTQMIPQSLDRDAAGLARALDALGLAARFNVRAARHEFQLDGEWRQATDRMEAAIQEKIATTFATGRKRAPLRFGEPTWRRSLNALLDGREVDPFVEWLDALPPWDGTPRLDDWLHTVFDTDPTCALTSWASRYLFLGPVWRAYRPGTKLDEMPVLIGPQGCGKSSALRMALPPDHAEWFADGLHLAADPKARAEALQGRVVVEASEMAGASRADLEALKAFLSRTDDGSVRLAYRRNPETLLRRCIVAGTANEDCLPNDPTGLRRFVAVRVGNRSVPGLRRYLDANRDQLWGEAIVLYHAGTEARLPDHLAGAQAMANETARRRDDLLEDALSRWLSSAPATFTLADAAVGCGLVDDEDRATRLPMRDQRRLGAALRSEGFASERRQESGLRVTRWERAA